ncbi:hypothetical protein SDC9_119833 [bioreactor metagenome]|uniref:Uncharacterized protein n=1 Tax=bioreactor metagenome TaxID=1076179 RepID=A0A645C6S1_9ZZZZ
MVVGVTKKFIAVINIITGVCFCTGEVIIVDFDFSFCFGKDRAHSRQRYINNHIAGINNAVAARVIGILIVPLIIIIDLFYIRIRGCWNCFG